MKLSNYLLCLSALCFSTVALAEETPAPVEEVAAEAAPAMEEKAEMATETVEEKVEEVTAETTVPS